MKIHILTIAFLSMLFGCKSDHGSTGGKVFLGGEIINPNNKYVLFKYPNSQHIDTLPLNDNNRFSKAMDSLKPGIYTFLHGGEYQLVFLEPGDSIMLRLNTMDFDESLVFTGRGAKKNNFFITSFLRDETDNNRFMRLMWESEPKVFEKALDSNRLERFNILREYLKNNDESDYFTKIAVANINYNYYANKELYPFGYYGYSNLIHFKDLIDDGFYDFRKDLDYNDESLMGCIPYTKFLFWHFNNLALNKYYKNASHNVVFSKESAAYNLEKLRLMDSTIDNETVKNHLLKYSARDFITTSKDSLETDEILTSFLEKSTNENDREYIKGLVSSVKRMSVGKPLPNVTLLDFDENKVSIRSLIKRPTVIYFWSYNQPSQLKNYHLKAQSLKTKYPEIDFIAISINDDETFHWKNTLKQFNLPKSNQFHFMHPHEAVQTLSVYGITKTILVNTDGTIVVPNGYLITSEFEEELAKCLKK